MKNRTRTASLHQARPRRRGRARLFVLGTAFLASGVSSARPVDAAPARAGDGPPASKAEAQGPRVMTFEIKAGALDGALADFRRVTGLDVVLTDPALGTIQSSGVSGVWTPEQAMERLLMGTSVRATFSGRRVTLDVRGVDETVQVRGAAPAPSSPKYTEPIRDTPQTIVVIPQQVISEQGATSLRDALRNTPGITLTAGEGGTAPGDNLLIRGFSARNDVYIDGARDPGVISRDTFNTEAVEVAKGPSSVTAGRGSTGGSVNLVTKAANLRNSVDGRIMAGNADSKRGTLDVNHRIGQDVAIRLNGMWQDSGIPGRDVATQKGWGFAPSVGIGLGRPTQVTLGYQHLQQNNIPDYGLPSTLPDLAIARGETVDQIDFSNFYGLVGRDHEKVRSDVGTVTVTHRFARSISLRNLTRYGRNYLDRVVTPPRAASAANAATDPGFDPAIPQIRRTDTKYQYRDDETLTNQTDFSADLKTGTVQHAMVVGLELAGDQQPSYAVADAFTNGRPPVTDLFRPSTTDTYAPALVRTGATSEATSRSAALYAFDTVKLNDRVQLDLGGRFDRVTVDYDTVAAVTGVAAQFGRTDRALSGRAGIVYKPTARGSVYTAYSTSFNPSYDGSFGITLAGTGVNNAALPPERSRNMEVGTKWDVRTLFVTAALFRTEKTNAKTTDASGATILAGDQQVNGVEFGVSGNVTPAWGVFSGLSLMDGTVKESGVAAEVGKRLSYVPRASFNLWTTYKLPMDVTIGGGTQFTDGYFFNNTNAFATANAAVVQRLTKYWLFSAMGVYQVNRHMNLQVNATNLTNERYVERGYTGHFVPGPGRAIVVSPVISF